MSDNKCFVCLEKSNNKVCKSCNCYAHASCWAKYVKSKNKLEVYSSLDTPDVIMLSVDKLTCPQCRKKINVNNTITRSKTNGARWLFIMKSIIDFTDEMELIQTLEDKKDLIRRIFKFVKMNKKILNKLDVLDFFRNQLERLYCDGFKNVNMYYYEIFGKQIEKLYT